MGGIIISKNKLYIGLYALALLVPFVIKSFEVNVCIAILLLFLVLFGTNLKLSRTATTSLIFLLGIFLIGFLSHFFYKNTLYNTIKDIVYLLKPFIYLLLGFALASKIKNKGYIFKVIIYLGVLMAVVHLFNVFTYLIKHGGFEIARIRYIGGKDNFLELIACSLLIFNKKNKYFNISFKYKNLVYLILTLSFIFYFSRTMVVAFLILLLAVYGYTKLTRKAIIIGVLLVIGVLGFYKLLSSFDIERGASGLEGFLYKLKIAPSEIFSSDINMKDASERWDHWRAYEAKRAFETMQTEQSILPYIIGMGSGSLIDLGFVAPLGNENMQYIPKIHNGFVYVFFKTGIIGLFFYFLFLINLYLQSYIRTSNQKLGFINNFISGIAIVCLFTSFIISGIFNPKDIISLVIGALLFLQLHYNKNT